MIGNKHGTATRSAFTLIELLVVIGIIAILASLLGAAVMKMIPTQVRKNTESTIRKSNSLLQRNWKAVIDQAAAEYRNPQIVPSAVIALAGGDMDRLKVIWTKLRLTQQFPMSYAEAKNPSSGYISAEPAYAKLPNSANASSTEMGACLLLALTAVKRSGVNIDSDLLNSLEARDTDGDGFLEILDGWGTALGFFRWPQGNVDMKALGSGDPEDPMGRLQSGTWTGVSTLKSTLVPKATYQLGVYTVPVIASAGPDRFLGYNDLLMTPITSGQNAGQNYDNILSYDLR